MNTQPLETDRKLFGPALFREAILTLIGFMFVERLKATRKEDAKSMLYRPANMAPYNNNGWLAMKAIRDHEIAMAIFNGALACLVVMLLCDIPTIVSAVSHLLDPLAESSKIPPAYFGVIPIMLPVLVMAASFWYAYREKAESGTLFLGRQFAEIYTTLGILKFLEMAEISLMLDWAGKKTKGEVFSKILEVQTEKDIKTLTLATQLWLEKCALEIAKLEGMESSSGALRTIALKKVEYQHLFTIAFAIGAVLEDSQLLRGKLLSWASKNKNLTDRPPSPIRQKTKAG